MQRDIPASSWISSRCCDRYGREMQYTGRTIAGIAPAISGLADAGGRRTGHPLLYAVPDVCHDEAEQTDLLVYRLRLVVRG